jgi:hypothetical protein
VAPARERDEILTLSRRAFSLSLHADGWSVKQPRSCQSNSFCAAAVDDDATRVSFHANRFALATFVSLNESCEAVRLMRAAARPIVADACGHFDPGVAEFN